MNELRPAALRQTINDRPPRVLVVEDETALAMLLVYNLQSKGFIAEHVDRGDEAELRLSEAPPDLVILDWMLPGLSGLEICHRLRARNDSRDIPHDHAHRALRRKRTRAAIAHSYQHAGSPFG